jgi:hypothetical protein
VSEQVSQQNDLTELQRTAYAVGFIAGLRCFAHWVDGVEYVGTGGTTLADAVERLETLWNFKP